MPHQRFGSPTIPGYRVTAASRWALACCSTGFQAIPQEAMLPSRCCISDELPIRIGGTRMGTLISITSRN